MCSSGARTSSLGLCKIRDEPAPPSPFRSRSRRPWDRPTPSSQWRARGPRTAHSQVRPRTTELSRAASGVSSNEGEHVGEAHCRRMRVTGMPPGSPPGGDGSKRRTRASARRPGATARPPPGSARGALGRSRGSVRSAPEGVIGNPILGPHARHVISPPRARRGTRGAARGGRAVAAGCKAPHAMSLAGSPCASMKACRKVSASPSGAHSHEAHYSTQQNGHPDVGCGVIHRGGFDDQENRETW